LSCGADSLSEKGEWLAKKTVRFAAHAAECPFFGNSEKLFGADARSGRRITFN
jgi:hypothetical protein